MAIVQTLFGDILDQFLPKTVRSKTGELNGGITGMLMPEPSKEMMIGQAGLRNLEEAGMPQQVRSDELAQALMDYKDLGDDQFARTDWLGKGVEIDVNADKTMYEIPDNEVRLLKGKDPEKIKGDVGFLELYKADLLENAYPDIGELKLRFYDDAKSSSAGGFDPVENVLTINRKHPYVKENGLKPTILHEVQHFVQAKEGLTFGESLAMRLAEEQDYVLGTNALNKSLDNNMVRSDLAKMLVENEKLGFTPTNVQLAIKQLAENPTEDMNRVLTRAFGDKTLAEKFISKVGAYPALRGIIESKELAEEGYRSAFRKYSSTGGEAFANASMVRGEMNQQQLNADAARNEIARQGLDVANLLPSSFQRERANELRQVQYADPMESSIQSSIPKGL
jgi:hypothetical protein